MDALIATAPPRGSVQAVCAALGVSRASLYRRRAEPSQHPRRRPTSAQALSDAERSTVLDALRFVDLAPAEIYAALLDEGVYLCSIRTFYRILADHGGVRERRDQLRHPAHQKP